jgi:transposase
VQNCQTEKNQFWASLGLGTIITEPWSDSMTKTLRKKSNDAEFLPGRILELYTQGESYASIGKTLNITKSMVQRRIQAYKSTGSMARKVGSGARRKSSPRDDRLIVQKVKKNPSITATEIKKQMPHLNLSTRSIRRRIPRPPDQRPKPSCDGQRAR